MIMSGQVSSSGVTKKKINFTIDGTSYEADEGMTWEQWVNSTYNTGGFVIRQPLVTINGRIVCTNSGVEQSQGDRITGGGIYVLRDQHNGGAG